MFVLNWIVLNFIWIASVVISVRHEPLTSDYFKNFDEAQKRTQSNMCPYLLQGSKRIPVICWMCHFPYGLAPNNKYAYDCCPGYTRSELIDNQCVSVEPSWKNMITYLKDKGHTNTAEALSGNTAIPDLASDQPTKVYTAFVPLQDTDITKAELDYTGRDNSARMLITSGRIYSNSFINGRSIKNEIAVPLKITTYSNGLSFIECRLITSVDHETTTGVVHFVDGALPATNRYPTVMSRLKSNPDLSRFVQAIPREVQALLDRPGSRIWFTVIAPTNRAWDLAVNSLQDKKAVADLARNHILPKMICASAIQQASQPVGPTQANDFIKFDLESNGEPVVIDSCNNRIRFAQKDLMTGNGVIHVIDRALVGLKALSLSEALDCLANDPSSGLSRGAKEIKECGLPTREKADVLLLPHDEAYQWLNSNVERSSENDRMRKDNVYRCNVYAYHMLTTSEASKRDPAQPGFAQEQRFKTGYTAPNGMSTFVSTYYIKERDGPKLSFNAAFVKDIKPIGFRDGLIYPVRTINFPPVESISDILKQEKELIHTQKYVESSGIEEDFRKQNGKLLFLASSNMGWSSRNVELSYSNKQMRKFLQLHTIPHVIFGGEDGIVLHSSVQTVNTLLTDRRGEKVRLTIRREPDGNTFIGHPEIPENLWAMVLRWNLLGTDGIIWVIDWPIQCPELECT